MKAISRLQPEEEFWPRRFFGKAFVLLAVLGLTCPLHAQTTNSTTNPCGLCELGAYSTSNSYLGLQTNSDTLVSIPFTRTPAFTGTVSSVSGNVVTVNGSPNWTTNQFVYVAGTQTNTYYAQMGPTSSSPADPKNGCTYPVTSNGASTLTLSLNGDNIGAVPANAQITVVPYWTLSTLFPAGNANVSFTPSANSLALKTQILIPDYSATGENLSASTIYYYLSNGSNVGWRMVGDSPSTNHGDDILVPDGYITVRNQNGAPTLPLVVTGTVPMGTLAVPLNTLTTGPQDNATAIIRPIGVSLDNSGLNPTDGSFVATSSLLNFADQLFIYNNTEAALNKSASSIYYYIDDDNGTNVGWRLVGDNPATDHGGDLIPAGSAITIRKAATSEGQSVFWTNAPTY